MTLAAEWRRIPLSQCHDCPKLTAADRERCQRCSAVLKGAGDE